MLTLTSNQNPLTLTLNLILVWWGILQLYRKGAKICKIEQYDRQLLIMMTWYDMPTHDINESYSA